MGVIINPYPGPAPADPGALYLDNYTGTADQKMSSALTQVFANGGGSILLGAESYSFANQWSTAYSAGVVTGVKIQGAGASCNGSWGTPSGATTVTFTYSGSGVAMMDFQHIGSIEITGIWFKQANTGKPFFQTTNATPNIHDNVFSGGGSGQTCTVDAILLGGTGTSTGAGDTAKYNAYQGWVYRNFFDGIRSGVTWQTEANGVAVRDNTWSVSCGSSSSSIGAMTISPNTSALCVGGMVSGNLIETSNYIYSVWADYCIEFYFNGNNFYDSTTTTLAHYKFNSVNASNNWIMGGYFSTANGAVPVVQAARINNFFIAINGYESQFGAYGTIDYENGIITNGEYNGVPHWTIGDSSVEAGNIPTVQTGTTNPNTAGTKAGTPGSIYIYRQAATGAGAFFLKQGTGDSQWFVPGSLLPVTTQTASYDVGADDFFVIMNGSSLTATLLAPATALTGKTWSIINKNASSLTVAPASGTINGAASITVAQYATCRVMTDGTNYFTC